MSFIVDVIIFFGSDVSGGSALFREAFSSGAGTVLSEAQRAQDKNERAETLAERTYSGREQGF